MKYYVAKYDKVLVILLTSVGSINVQLISSLNGLDSVALFTTYKTTHFLIW